MLTLFFAAMSLSAQGVSVQVKKAGTLAECLSDYDIFSITQLTVTGNINGDDIFLIRRMAGYLNDDNGSPDPGYTVVPKKYISNIFKEAGDEEDEDTRTGILEKLDLSGAKIVIGGSAFYTNNEGKKYYTKANSLAPYTFWSCWRLKDIKLPTNITSIEEGALYNCFYLSSIDIPEGVKTIGKNAFRGDWRLNNINFPLSLTEIGENAFWGTGFKEFIVPDNVTKLGTRFLTRCDNLTKITIGSGVTKLPQAAFAMDSFLVEVSLPSSLKTIGQSAFIQCHELKSIDLPEGLDEIDQFAFMNMRGLESISLPSTLTHIGAMAFSHSEKLSEIIIPDAVTGIGQCAFHFCI